MKKIISILILSLVNCSCGHLTDKNGKTIQSDKSDISNTSNDCPDKNFSKPAGDFVIRAIYTDCEPDWKYKLKILKNNKIIFESDSLIEYEFKKSFWPGYIKISKDTTQILLEVNDRPFTNYVLCLTISNDKVINTVRFPIVENDPKDFDNDGLLEYVGYSYDVEGYTNDSCYYNPVIYVEKSSKGFYLDQELIKSVNSMLYGNFYGMKASETIKLKNPPNDSLRKYLNE